MQAFREVATSEDLPPTVDRDWLNELKVRLDPRGAKVELARQLGVDPSQISKLLSGSQAPAHLVVGVSRHLGMMLPRTWFADREYRVLLALRRAESLAVEPGDPRRRAALTALVDALADDVETQVDDMVEHLGALTRTWLRKKRFEDGGS